MAPGSASTPESSRPPRFSPGGSPSGSTEERPRLSVAIPLYRSRRFVAIVEENIRGLGDLDAEILVSDRHGDDDALAILRERLGGDRRIRFLEERDRVGWVDHYNLLLGEARGRLFLWMPHDDSFPPGCVARLSEALDTNPAALLAFPEVRRIDLDGTPLPPWPPPPASGEVWSKREAVRWLVAWLLGIPFRGVFRTDAIRDRGLFLRRTPESRGADSCWVFAVGWLGALVPVPGAVCTKRFHPESAHAGWEPLLRAPRLVTCSSYVRSLGGGGWRGMADVATFLALFLDERLRLARRRGAS